MDELLRLLRLMADGRIHSGTELGRHLGISRAAVWKRLNHLPRLGLEVEAVPGRGYRLRRPLDLLDAAAISAPLADRFDPIEILPTVDSTNRHLARQLPWNRPRVCLAEHQSAGRGRRGRRWHSPLGASLYLSVGWPFPTRPAQLETLALRSALVLAETLDALGLAGIGLKWPNDLLVNGRKLAGILIELSGEWGGPQHAIIGIGVNCHLPDDSPIDQQWTDLQREMGPRRPDRNRLAAALLERLGAMLDELQRGHPSPWRRRWARYELYRDRPVRLHQGPHAIYGIHRGVAEDGALLLERDGRLQRHYAGDVSLRPETP